MEFLPTGMRLVEHEDQLGLAVGDDTGAYQGIVIPRELETVVRELLPGSGPRFSEFWRSYERTRGGDAFFWDLTRLLSAVSRVPRESGIRGLIGFRAADELLHSAYQAHVMAVAHDRHPDAVALVRESGSARTPDFKVTVPPVLWIEVKAVSRMATLDLMDEGVRVRPRDVEVFHNIVAGKASDAFEQLPTDGTAVVAIWCDAFGSVLARLTAGEEQPEESAVAPSQLALAFRDQEGSDRWLIVERAQWREQLDELFRRLAVYIAPPPIRIPFSGGSVSFAKGANTVSMGRIVSLRNLSVDYGGEELNVAALRRQVQSREGGRVRTASEIVARFSEVPSWLMGELERKPFEAGTCSLAQAMQDERWVALFEWSAGVRAALAALQLDLSEVAAGRPNEDARGFLEATRAGFGEPSAIGQSIQGMLKLRPLIPKLQRLTSLLKLVCESPRGAG